MNLIKLAFNKFFNLVGNTLGNIVSNRNYKLSYVAEKEDWVIKQVGKELVSYLEELDLIKARITTTHLGIRNQIIHFGAANTFLKPSGFQKPHQSNRLVLSWYHFIPGIERNKYILKSQKYLDFIHTACQTTKDNLINFGVDPKKIVVIPEGIDLSLFKPVSLEEKQKIRKQLNIPEDKIVIGSFQKDGVGWDKGLEPKMEKGPDIFIKAVEKIAKEYPVYVLLVGPARGYVKSNLEKRNIPYKDVGRLDDFKEVVNCYPALDLYLITSRIEGGPRAILESWASGVPLISTKMGMVPDIAKDGENTLLAEVENVNQISEKAKQIIEDKKLRDTLVKNAIEEAKKYSWSNIAQRYYQEIYSKIL